MESVRPPRLPLRKRLQLAWKNARLWMVLLLALVAGLVVLSLPLSSETSSVVLAAGEVASYDIMAPSDLTYTSEVLTEQARQEAALAVPDQFDPPDSAVARGQLERMSITLDFIDSVRGDTNATAEQKMDDLSGLEEVRLSEAEVEAILSLPDARWEAVKLEALSVLGQVMREEIRDDRLEEKQREVPAKVISLPQDQADLVVLLVHAFLVPNARYNEAATLAARQQARDSVSPVTKSYVAGETIVGLGGVVTPLEIEALDSYGLLRPQDPWKELLLRGLLLVLLSVPLVLYGYRALAGQLLTPRVVSTLAALLLLVALGMRLALPGHAVLPYLFPYAVLPILMTVSLGTGLGIVAALVTSILAGYLAPRGLEIAVLALLSGAVGALTIGRADRMSSFLSSGLAVGGTSSAVVVLFRLLDPTTDALGKATLLGAAMGSGVLSAILSLGLLLPLSSLLGIITSLQLLELARPDHPLQQLILRNSPGTYQHSLQVANLAETAAREIDANPLLTRVGSLYHDAGKSVQPQFFIENQPPGQNVHEQLDPTTSSSMIRAHVPDGMKLARKYRLPRAVEAFIAEHHGTTQASYLYQEALAAAGGDASHIDSREFVYPGPIPHSRETALVMLADGVEAKARADMPKDDEEIERLIRWIIQDRLESDQLGQTDLTLRDLETIRRSFVNSLKGIYHPRIRYPTEEAEAGQPA